jgi:hypothetical protein
MSVSTVNVSQSDFILAALNPDQPSPTGLVGPDGEPCPKRFSVYRNNIMVSLKEALSSGFPAVSALVGPDFFAAMSGIYIRENPPISPILAFFGETFAEFIKSFPPAEAIPYLADVAQFEYALRRSYHAADAAAVSPELLQDPRLFTARVTLAPAVQTLTSQYPVTQIHAAAMGGPAPTGSATDILITRPDLDPIATAFPAGTAAIIDALQARNTLADAIELAPASLDLTILITALISGSAITHLEFDNV